MLEGDVAGAVMHHMADDESSELPVPAKAESSKNRAAPAAAKPSSVKDDLKEPATAQPLKSKKSASKKSKKKSGKDGDDNDDGDGTKGKKKESDEPKLPPVSFSALYR
jgi:hypothetical protein